MAGAANGTMFSNEPCRVRKYSARLTRLNSNERAVCFVSIGTPLEVWRRLLPSALDPRPINSTILGNPGSAGASWARCQTAQAQPSGDIMALPHAQPRDVIDVRPLNADLPDAVTTSLLKTPALQLMRLVLRAGHGLPEHSVPGAITIHCLEGEAAVTTPECRCHLRAGQLVMLTGSEPHAVMAITDASLLVTVLLNTLSTESQR
jgi:quercetin dioxygenase-like cupin family protein